MSTTAETILAPWLVSVPTGEISVQRWSPAQPRLGAVPWLLFHDSLGCNAMWRDFPQALADATGQLVIGYDRVGFGLSSPRHEPPSLSFIRDEAELVEQLLEQLGLTQFMAFGHSVGGAIAVEVAARLPYDCVALVTAAAQCRVEAQTLDGIRRAQAEFSPSTSPISTSPVSTSLESSIPASSIMQRLQKYHGDRTEWVVRAWTDTWLNPAFAHWTLDDALRRVTCPSLVLHGDHDEYATLAQPKHMASLLQGPVMLKLLPQGQHLLHRQDPTWVLGCIEQFLVDLG